MPHHKLKEHLLEQALGHLNHKRLLFHKAHILNLGQIDQGHNIIHRYKLDLISLSIFSLNKIFTQHYPPQPYQSQYGPYPYQGPPQPYHGSMPPNTGSTVPPTNPAYPQTSQHQQGAPAPASKNDFILFSSFVMKIFF